MFRYSVPHALARGFNPGFLFFFCCRSFIDCLWNEQAKGNVCLRGRRNERAPRPYTYASLFCRRLCATCKKLWFMTKLGSELHQKQIKFILNRDVIHWNMKTFILFARQSRQFISEDAAQLKWTKLKLKCLTEKYTKLQVIGIRQFTLLKFNLVILHILIKYCFVCYGPFVFNCKFKHHHWKKIHASCETWLWRSNKEFPVWHAWAFQLLNQWHCGQLSSVDLLVVVELDERFWKHK